MTAARRKFDRDFPEGFGPPRSSRVTPICLRTLTSAASPVPGRAGDPPTHT